MPMPWSRRAPWPYLMRVNGVGVMLRAGQNGQLPALQVNSLSAVVPRQYDYGSSDPFKDRVSPFAHLTGGMGEKYQTSATDRYLAAVNVDASIGGLIQKGPHFHSDGAISPGRVNQFVVGMNGSVETLFALKGGSVYVSSDGPDGPWALSTDALVFSAVQAVRWQYTGGPDAIYVVTHHITAGGGELWQYDGTTWTKATLPAGFKPESIAVINDSLYLAGGGILRVVNDLDPLLAGSYGGAIQIGDGSAAVTHLAVVSNQLFIFKATPTGDLGAGLYSIVVNADATISVVDLFQQIRGIPAGWGGRGSAVFRDALWFPFGAGFYRLTGGTVAGLAQIGPELFVENDSEVKGSIVGAAVAEPWFLYALMNTGTASGDCYLMKYGSWLPPDAGSPADGWQFAEQWNGATKKWAGKVGACALATTVVGGQSRLYVGFLDGSIEWCVLPAATPNPSLDPACEFNTDDGWIEAPLHTMLAEADNKHWRAVESFGPVLTADNLIRIKYRTDLAAGFSDFGSDFTAPGQRESFPESVVGRLLNFRVYLVNARPESSPVISGIGLVEQIRPAFLLEFDPTVIAQTNQTRRDGMSDPRTADEVRAALQALVGAGPTTFVLPDESVQQLSVIDYQEAMAPVGSTYGPAWDIALKAIQWKTNTVFGTWGRVGVHTWGEVGKYAWGDVRGL